MLVAMACKSDEHSSDTVAVVVGTMSRNCAPAAVASVVSACWQTLACRVLMGVVVVTVTTMSVPLLLVVMPLLEQTGTLEHCAVEKSLQLKWVAVVLHNDDDAGGGGGDDGHMVLLAVRVDEDDVVAIARMGT